MSEPDAHIKFQYDELHKLDEQLGMMRKWGVLETDPGFKALFKARGAALGKLGLRRPSITSLIRMLPGLSPGEVRLWADAEKGWMIEARAEPSAQPKYKYVSDEVAEKIVKEELTHEEFLELLVPDPYLGE